MRALKRVEGINVVPLIDVVLVLLAIVLTLSTFVATGQIKIELPSAKSSEKPLERKKIEVSITSEGAIFYNGERVDKDGFEHKIAPLTKEDAVSLRADKKSAFEDFVFVMDRLKTKGIEKIAVTTRGEG